MSGEKTSKNGKDVFYKPYRMKPAEVYVENKSFCFKVNQKNALDKNDT